MQASKFNALLKYADVEDQGGNDYCLYSEHDESFYFHFSLNSIDIKYPEDLNLTDLQIQKIEDVIYSWCDDKVKENNNEAEAFTPDDYQHFISLIYK